MKVKMQLANSFCYFILFNDLLNDIIIFHIGVNPAKLNFHAVFAGDL